jgi:isoleucyl-tRNA synthetase
MTDYKDTLNLPSTGFAMKANLPSKEPKMIEFWEEMDLRNEVAKAREGRDKFILHDGPPYANGQIHTGHAAQKVLKDMVIKSQTLDGKYAPFVPGWDCHGLPIELNVEKKIGKVGHKVTASEFREACRKYASSQIELQKKDFKRLGIVGDWDNPYVTMDFVFEANIIRSLGKIIEKGHLQRGDKPVHWCVDCGSSLAEAEVEYQDKISSSIDFIFPIEDPELLKIFKTDSPNKNYVASWTTTPWTLPGNLALTINETFVYQLIEINFNNKNINLILAEDLVKDTLDRISIKDHQVLGSCQGSDLLGLKASHPYLDRDSLIIAGDHVTTEAGTGIVHTAPGHGLEDYAVSKENGLEVLSPVKGNGTYHDDVEHFAGQFVFKANDNIVQLLRDKGVLLAESSFEHSYPHCWRHKTPVMFRATPQWFISMEKAGLLSQSLDSIDSVRWEPDWGEARMQSMLESRPDWCISRQRSWGVPIALLIHNETGELHPKTQDIIEKVASLVEKQGIQAWHDVEMKDLVEDPNHYEKITDCLDVWFDSGVTHACVLDANEDLQFPADLYLEGSDQHRGWFQSSLLTSMAMKESAPYKAVLTHGFVVDGEGKKMSKSIGNVISPQKIWETMGADVLRSWVASTDYTKEIVLSDDILKRSADSYRRIRNTIRFLLGNLSDYSGQKVVPDKLTELDKWMILRTKTLQEEIKQDYLNYNFHQAFQKIHNFCANDLGGFYLDILKDRLYTAKLDSDARRSSQIALFNILQALLRWISPILSFTAEEAWQSLETDTKSVHLLEWFNEWDDIGNLKFSNDQWEKILEIRSEVNKHIEEARNKEIIGSSLDAEIELFCSKEIKDLLDSFSNELRFIFITSEAKVSELNEESGETNLEGMNIRVSKTTNQKCVRCWHSRPEVGSIKGHESICNRCHENVVGDGEIRIFA